jgi:hypothetical protein
MTCVVDYFGLTLFLRGKFVVGPNSSLHLVYTVFNCHDLSLLFHIFSARYIELIIV